MKLRNWILGGFSVVLVSFSLTGCATIFGGGSQQQITIDSKTPQKVIIGHTKDGKSIIDPQEVYVPAVVTIKRENKNLLIKTENGKTKLVKKKINPWFLGDVLSVSPISTTTDYLTGAMWKYDDKVSLDNK